MKRKRLTPEQAEFLGFEVKKRGSDGNAKYLIDSKQENMLGIEFFSKKHNLNSKDVHSGWIKDKDSSLYFQNPNFRGDEERKDEFAKKLIDSLKNHSPKYDKIKRVKSKDSHLLVIDPADIHIGKLCDSFESGDDYNSNIAVKRVLDGVDGILEKSNGFNINKINFIGGNDVLHIDTPRRTTTSGTPQDTCGMWYSNFLMAKDLYVDILEKLVQIADVHFTFNPSNHDYTNGFFLADVIKTHFRNCKNITFDCSISHRKYFKYGNNLIGSTHGDGAKQSDLPLIMANESKDWSSVKHRYIYVHHLHHKVSKDYHGVTVETLRSPSGTDSWHHRNGYGVGGVKAVEGFIHHPEHGQVARLSHIF